MRKNIGQFNLWNGEILWRKFDREYFDAPIGSICHGIILNISSMFGTLLRNFPDKRELKSVLQYLIGIGNFNANWSESVASTAIKIFYAVMNSDAVSDNELNNLRL